MATLNIPQKDWSKFISFIQLPDDIKSKLFESLTNYQGVSKHHVLVEQLHSKLITVLKKAEIILELKDNWDEEGSEHISPTTFSTAVYFLITYAEDIFRYSGNCIDIPSIYPSSNGSIDIDWETETYGLIINIAKDGAEASYYGDNKSSQMTEGVFNPHEFNINLLPKAITL
jgi:hypothetical protein